MRPIVNVGYTSWHREINSATAGRYLIICMPAVLLPAVGSNCDRELTSWAVKFRLGPLLSRLDAIKFSDIMYPQDTILRLTKEMRLSKERG